jgi:hypothetical protein
MLSHDESTAVLESAIAAGVKTFGDENTPLVEAVLLHGEKLLARACPSQSFVSCPREPASLFFESTSNSRLSL